MKQLTKKIATISVAALLAAGMAAVAAGDNGTETSASGTASSGSSTTNSSSASETSASDSSSGGAADVTIDYSGLSGEITVYMPSPAGLASKLCAGFEELTGVTVNLWTGTTGEITAKLTAEESNPQADVVILASWSDGLSLKSEGKLMSYQSPYAEYMHDGCVDDGYTLYGTSASAVGVIYNTNIYSAEEIESLDWSDYADSKFKDDISIPDPTKSGACKDFISGFVTAIDTDYSIIDSWAANGLTNGGGNSPALESVKSGEKGILIAGVDYNAYSAIASGEDIAIYYPESGTVINPRPAMIMNTAPHVDNAKAFMDYLMSDDAQQLVADAYLIPGRADVDCNSARLGFDDIKQYEVDWDKMMAVADTAASYVVTKTAGNI
ncbi:MAG: extracellular solute-binding protein [Clostridia bacterium]|nr:extracellular solute-binding protein [Clostridia bacterium]